MRAERSRPLIVALETWLREQRARVSKNSETGKAIDYSLKRWTALTRFLDDGRLCMTNNAAERELRAIAVGRRNWTFAGSDEGGRRAAALYTLIATAKLNDVDPQAWLADVTGANAGLPGETDRRPVAVELVRRTPCRRLIHHFRIETGELIGLPATLSLLGCWPPAYFRKMGKKSNSISTDDFSSLFSTLIIP